MKFIKNYSIGLDIGTNSVGWAVIDSDYKLCKLNGKDTWGAYIFDDAKTAVDRRLKRSQRRRYARRQERIHLLQSLMGDLVLAKDDSFFIRLKDSYLRSDITDTQYKRSNYFNLFEGDYTDKDYYKDYKTIYHLREHLYNSSEKSDIRLVYLALHHIIKYRGNFLYEGKTIDIGGGMLKESLANLFIMLEELLEIPNNYNTKIEEIAQILKNNTLSKPIKSDKLKNILSDKENKKLYQAIINLIMGNTANLSDILCLDSTLKDDEDKPIKIGFANADYDANEEMYLSLAEDKSDLLTCLKAIYTAILFENIMNGQNNISMAKISKYDKHNLDLKIFKRLIKNGFSIQINPETQKPFYTQYSKMFRSVSGKNYVNYIGSKTKNSRYEKRISKEVFYQSVSKLLEQLPDSEDKNYCLKEIASNNFLPTLNNVENSVIPYQLNKEELIRILENQSVHYPQLSEVKDKILSILEFKRPYYVGTLKGDFSWCEQKINERITPWNFYDLVDTDTLAEKFILKMTNFCNVFKDECTLPKNSITYQAYVTLNELNKLKYKDKTISTEWKKLLFHNLCCKNKTVKLKSIANELKKNYNIAINDGDLTGLADDKLNGTMSTYIEFKRILNIFDITKLPQYEEAIKILSIFDDLKIRKNRLMKLNIFSENEILALSKFKFSGWGKYSNKLLNNILSTDKKTIMETLYDTDKNINELLFDKKLDFISRMPQENTTIDSFDYKRDVKDLYCSPSVKKSIWNTLKIVEEIAKISKCEPTRIFLEDTHDTNEKKKTESRLNQLSAIYKAISNEEYFNSATNFVLQDYNQHNKKLNDDKLYLWLTQLGRCMYSGATIPFEQLINCEIDHIVPRSYIKDDSFENRVLVTKLENQTKTDTLSINSEIKKKMKDFWTFLNKHNLIGSKKMTNLTRGEYSENDKIGFINRQLVETNQIIKETNKILSKRFPNAVIVGIRAKLNSNFRNKYSEQNKSGFFKLRKLNQLHHAKDAYLTAVLGQFTTVACPMWGQDNLNRAFKYYIANNDKSKYDIKTLVNKRHGLILDLMQYGECDKFSMDENGEYMWDTQKYNNIFDVMEKNTCLIVKKKRIMANNDFYKETIWSPTANKRLLPLKSKNGEDMPTKIYGGYTEEHPAYFVIVKYLEVRKKSTVIKYKIESIPVLKVIQNKKDSNIISEYLKSIYGESVEVIKKLYKHQLINYDGHLCYIVGDGELNNAQQLFIDSKYEKLLYLIEKEKTHTLSHNVEETGNLIKEFISHYNYKIRKYLPLYTNFANKLDSILANSYENLSIQEKISLVEQMLIVSSAGAGRIQLDEKYDNGGNFGRLVKTIYPEKVEFIDSSCTGLYSTSKRGI